MSDLTIGFGSSFALPTEEHAGTRTTEDPLTSRSTRDAFSSRPCPLTSADEATWLRVVALKAGDRFRRKLGALGIKPGSNVRIVCRTQGGPLVVALGGVGEARIAIGAGMAARITVVPSEDFCKQGAPRQ